MAASPQSSVFTLLDIGRSLQRMISTHYSKPYWIKTEIAKLNAYTKSGHCYPDLVEKQNGEVLAQMRATIWNTTFKTISKQFEDVTKQRISEGMTVLLLAKVNYHPNYGFSLNIIDIDPSFTLGEMAKEKSESLKRLKAEGIYNANRSLLFPKLPRRIAVISVETSKGYQDFKNIIEKFSHFNINVELFSALLQGDKAINSISEALEHIANQSHRFDVVTIIRGGGGDVGLSCYDSFILASKVARFPLPIISGIGHSTNQTLLEMVSYANKITPTDVAYFFISKFQNAVEELKAYRTRFKKGIESKIITERNSLQNHHLKFKTQVESLLQNQTYLLQVQQQRIQSRIPTFVQKQMDFLQNSGQRLSWMIKQHFQKQNNFIKQTQTHIKRETSSNLRQHEQNLAHLHSTVNLLSPKRLLQRGYTLNLVNDKIIKSSKDLKTGDRLKTVFFDGYAESEVLKTKTDE